MKVRVNVSNPEGKLKPSMFVRGVTRAEIAGGGRVIDAELAGKWISPMHPEVVKDEPGKCDICGMPLVRAESLGYVSTEDLLTEPPLVVPASAVLWTGTRAVIYVEVPGREQPTYEGREIVLGPRAGDYYLVRSGLRVGELVVTQGNFKIDSALQIQARPSMMTPEGGGGGGHQHDHGAPATAAEQPGMETMIQAPADFVAQLERVDVAYQQILQAERDSDLRSIRQAFHRLGEAVNAVDGELVRGHAGMLWREFQMLLGNDAVEGQEAATIDAAQRVVRRTERTMERVRDQLMPGEREHAGHAEHATTRLEVPEPFARQIAAVLQAYFNLQGALAADDRTAAHRSVAELRSTAEQVDDRELSDATRRVWHRERENLRTILSALEGQEELREIRAAFSQISGEMEGLVQRFGAGPAGPVYRVHCPMAFGNQGAWWLQQTEEIRNPYFGATMLKCHDRLEKIASGTAEHPEEHVHE